jgi:hypothetical protein
MSEYRNNNKKNNFRLHTPGANENYFFSDLYTRSEPLANKTHLNQKVNESVKIVNSQKQSTENNFNHTNLFDSTSLNLFNSARLFLNEPPLEKQRNITNFNNFQFYAPIDTNIPSINQIQNKNDAIYINPTDLHPQQMILIYQYDLFDKKIQLHVSDKILLDEKTLNTIDFLIYYLGVFSEYYEKYDSLRKNMDPFLLHFLDLKESLEKDAKNTDDVNNFILKFIKKSMPYLLKVKKFVFFDKKKYDSKFTKKISTSNPDLMGVIKNAWLKSHRNKRLASTPTFTRSKKVFLFPKKTNSPFITQYNMLASHKFPFNTHFQTIYFNLIEKMTTEQKIQFRDIYENIHYTQKNSFLHNLIYNTSHEPYFSQIYLLNEKKPYSIQALLFLSPYIDLNDNILNKYLISLKGVYLYFGSKKIYKEIFGNFNTKLFNTNYELINFLNENIFKIIYTAHDETTPLTVISIILEPIREISPQFVEKLVMEIQLLTMRDVLQRCLTILEEKNYNYYIGIRKNQNKKDLDSFFKKDIVPGLSRHITLPAFENIFYKIYQDQPDYYKDLLSIFKKKQKEYAKTLQ